MPNYPYDKKYDPNYCQRLIDHMAQGGNLSSFCGKIGIGRKTAEAWKRKKPKFSKAHNIGKMKLKEFLAAMLAKCVTENNYSPQSVALYTKFQYFEEFGASFAIKGKLLAPKEDENGIIREAGNRETEEQKRTVFVIPSNGREAPETETEE